MVGIQVINGISDLEIDSTYNPEDDGGNYLGFLLADRMLPQIGCRGSHVVVFQPQQADATEGHLFCFDTASKTLCWRHDFGAGYFNTDVHRNNVGSPEQAVQMTIAGDDAYVVEPFIDGATLMVRVERFALNDGTHGTATFTMEDENGIPIPAGDPSKVWMRELAAVDGSLVCQVDFDLFHQALLAIEGDGNSFVDFEPVAVISGPPTGEPLHRTLTEYPLPPGNYRDTSVPVQFGSSGSVDPDGGTLTYLWDFGDGTTSTNADPVHAYVSAGSAPDATERTIMLTVVDDEGNTNGPATLQIASRDVGGVVVTTLQAVADAYVDFYSTRRNTNYGSLPVINISGKETSTQHGYVRFDATGIDPSQIVSATLRLWSEPNQWLSYYYNSLVVHEVSDVWDEGTITWANAPGLGDGLGGYRFVYPEVRTFSAYIDVPITGYAKRRVPDGSFSVGLAMLYANGSLSPSSREGDHPPELILQLGDPGYQAPQILDEPNNVAIPVDSLSVGISVAASSVLGESNLTYHWHTVSGEQSHVTFDPNHANAAKDTILTLSTNSGTYSVQCVVYDGLQSSTSRVATVVAGGCLLSYGSSAFNESPLNDGSINNASPVTITLTGDTLTGTNGEDFVESGKVAVINLPANMTAVIKRTSATILEATLTGAATAHADNDDVSNLTFTFQDGAFTGANATAVTGYSKDDLIINFMDEPNAPPVANDQSVGTDEDTVKDITLVASDINDDELAFSIVANPTHGVLSGASSNVTYTPAANFNGSDSFAFKASDGIDDSNIATVSVTVAAVNDAPVAYGQSVITTVDTAKAIKLSGSDVDGDELTFIIESNPSTGTLSGTSSNVTYAPHAGFTGEDSFKFKVNDGETDSNKAVVTITVGPADTTPDFVCAIRASGGDYTNLSTWEAAIESDLTASSSQLFAVSDRGTYDAVTDDGDTVTFSGGGSGTLKHINAEDKAFIVLIGGTVNAGTVTCDTSAHTFVVTGGGTQIGSAVAECYNDWPAGLNDTVDIIGWTTAEDRNVWIRVPQSERHTGKLKAAGGEYTGFTIAATASPISVKEQYTEIEGLAIERISGYLQGISVGEWLNKGHHAKVHHCLIVGFGNTYCGLTTYAATPVYVYNNVFVESKALFGAYCTEVYCYNNTLYGCRLEANLEDATRARNNLVYYEGGDCYQGAVGGYNAASSHNISSDATAPGASSLTNQTLLNLDFVSTVSGSEDLHIAESSSAANVGVSDPGAGLYSDDIDGDIRSGAWDIGADEVRVEAPTHEITVLCGPYGSVTPNGVVPVEDGGGASFAIDAAAHYHIASILVDSAHVAGSPFADNSYTNDTYLWSNITSDAELEVMFGENIWTNGTPETWLARHYPWAPDYDEAALSDTDADGLSAWAEYIAGTDPTNDASVLRIEIIPSQALGMNLRMESVAGRRYRVDYLECLTGVAPWGILTNDVPGTGEPLEFHDDEGAAARLYRGRVWLDE